MRLYVSLAAVFATVATSLGSTSAVLDGVFFDPVAQAGTTLGFDSTNPFYWNNDSEDDAHSGSFILSLAQTQRIWLVGMSQSPSPAQPLEPGRHDGLIGLVGLTFNIQAPLDHALAAGWNVGISNAADLGENFRHALVSPHSAEGPGDCDTSPTDDCIDITTPIVTAAAWDIVVKAYQYGTPERPLVIGTGGPLTSIASAYLLARQYHDLYWPGEAPFEQRVILVAGITQADSGSLVADYNAAQDALAAFICLRRLRVVLASYDLDAEPTYMDAYIRELLADPTVSQHPMVQRLEIEREVISTLLPSGYDLNVIGDIQPVLLFLNPQIGTYFNDMIRVSAAIGSWEDWRFAYEPSPINWDHAEWVVNFNVIPRGFHWQPDDSSDDIRVSAYDPNVANAIVRTVFDEALGR